MFSNKMAQLLAANKKCTQKESAKLFNACFNIYSAAAMAYTYSIDLLVIKKGGNWEVFAGNRTGS